MTRGNQKIEAQKRAQKKADAAKKTGSQMEARKAALQIVCPACRTNLAHYNTLKEHMEAKHPGVPIPPKEEFEKK